MRKAFAFVLSVALAISYMPAFAEENNISDSVIMAQIWVSENGNDEDGNGSKEYPFKSIDRARKYVRTINDNMTGDIIVNIEGGTYNIETPIYFNDEDGATNGKKIIYKGINRPTLSGGVNVTGFIESSLGNGIYEASFSGADKVSALYVNGERRYIARSEKMYRGIQKPEEMRTRDWYENHPDDVEDNYNWYDEETPYTYDGIVMNKSDIADFSNIEDVIFVWNLNWKFHTVKVNEILPNPYDEDSVFVRMSPGFWEYFVCMKEAKGQENYPAANHDFYIANALELLDAPGEFYYDRYKNIIYYMPKRGEDMKTANVVVPIADQLINIEGDDIDKKVQGLCFTGFNFMHTQFNCWLDGFCGEQGIGNAVGYDVPTYTTAAVYVDRGENIEFTDNNFFGLGGVGIHAYNGVHNSNFSGNAFSDIGDAAVVVGTVEHMEIHNDGKNTPIMGLGDDFASDSPPETETELCLTNRYETTVSVSNYPMFKDFITYLDYKNRLKYEIFTPKNFLRFKDSNGLVGAESWENEYLSDGNWIIRAETLDKGEKVWARVDLKREYPLSRIVLAFHENSKPEERTGYEILASNDKNFKAYDVIATETAAADMVNEYKVVLESKYRYVMVRTLGSTTFSLGRISIFTDARKPYMTYETCQNNVVNNNYITRAAADTQRAPAVLAYYTIGTKIQHNEISNIGYSGISNGWGWFNFRKGTYNTDISNNHIYNTNRVTYDGGPIYTLGTQPGSVYNENVTHDQGVSFMNLYTDQGTSDTVWQDNVSYNVSQIYGLWTNDVIRNKLSGYASHNVSNFFNDSSTGKTAETENEVSLEVFALGQPNKKAYAVMQRAGLEKEYEYLRDFVKDVDQNWLDGMIYSKSNYDRKPKNEGIHKETLEAEYETVMKKGVFGNGLGMYPIEQYYKLKNVYDRYKGGEFSDSVQSLFILKDALVELESSVRRYSLEETLQICRNELETARKNFGNPEVYSRKSTLGCYNADSIYCYENELKRIENELLPVYTEEEEYEALTSLENAYNTFTASKMDACITSIWAKGAVDSIIDHENREIKIIMPENSDLSAVECSITACDGAEIAVILDKELDLTHEYDIPVYSQAAKEYRRYILKAVTESYSEENVLNASAWFSGARETRNLIEADNALYLVANPMPYILKRSADIQGAISFTPISNSLKKNELSILLGINSPSGFEINSSDKVNNHIKINFKDNKAYISTVNANKESIIRECDAVINFNGENTISFSKSQAGVNTYLKILFNGTEIYAGTPGIAIGDYYGILSKTDNIRINK